MIEPSVQLVLKEYFSSFDSIQHKKKASLRLDQFFVQMIKFHSRLTKQNDAAGVLSENNAEADTETDRAFEDKHTSSQVIIVGNNNNNTSLSTTQGDVSAISSDELKNESTGDVLQEEDKVKAERAFFFCLQNTFME